MFRLVLQMFFGGRKSTRLTSSIFGELIQGRYLHIRQSQVHVHWKKSLEPRDEIPHSALAQHHKLIDHLYNFVPLDLRGNMIDMF